MSSRADQKRALREEREARERETTAKDQRRKRLYLLGGAFVAALVIAGVLIAVSQGGSDDNDTAGGGGGGGASDAAFVNNLYEGIPQEGAAIGNPNAPVTMVEFVDLQCPFCAEYTKDVLPTLVRKYVRPGNLRIEMRPLTFIGTDSEIAGNAAASAAVQNRMWQFTDLFYLNQGQENTGYVTDQFLRRIAVGAGVKPGPVLAAANSNMTPPLIALAKKEGDQLGVQSTPSFFVRQGDGELKPLDVSQLEVDQFTSQLDPLVARR